MSTAMEQIKQLTDVADAKMPGASTSIEQARIVADLGFECAATIAALLDYATARIDELEKQVEKLQKASKKPRK